MDSGAIPQMGRKVLTFRLDDRIYGLSATEVVEVIRLPAVARIPHSPKGLMGLANLRGAIIPVASGRNLLGQAVSTSNSAGRAIVLGGNASLAIAVDAVCDLLEVGPQEVMGTEPDVLPGEILSGSFRSPKDGRPVKLLDIHSLLKSAIVMEEGSHQVRGAALSGHRAVAEQSSQFAPTPKLISFAVDGQEYALPLDVVQEIIAAPATLASAPEEETVMLGVTRLRDQALSLLSLRGLLGFAPSIESGKQKVVLTRARGHVFGLVVDEMRSIFPADETRIDSVSDLLADRTGGESRIAGLYRGQDGRLVSILSPEQIFGDSVMQRLNATRTASPTKVGDTTASVETRQFVLFRLGEGQFALPVEAVEEVLNMPAALSAVPNSPKFLAGVINLRGQVLPILDQRKRFDMPPAASQRECRVIVVRTDRHLAGFIVDSVSEVLRARIDTIAGAPRLAGQKAKLVNAAINLPDEGRIILMLDPVELLSQAERGLLDKLAKPADEPGA